ncbi:MAG: GNAT family N-acetyltransferase [Candidatus Scalindua sp.]|jgi:hypothetical protein|nr:GNAT family N-acetyltransferase [Candidatus Scalindua sp.]
MIKSSYTTRYITNEEYKEWDELVLQSPNYSIFDTTLWLGTLTSILKCDIKILGVFKENNLVGGIALNIIKRFGIKIAKTPPMSAFNSCHYVLKETQHKDKLGNKIQNILAVIADRLQNDFHYAIVTNHPDFKNVNAFKWKGWRQNILYSYSVQLNNVDLSLISASKRRQVKKAQKKLIAVEEIRDIVPVYDIIEQTYIRQNLKCPLTLDEMTDIYKKIKNNIVILAAKEPANGKCIAVDIAIIDCKRKYAYSLINAYDFESADSGANSLVLWEGIEFFKNKGLEIFDLGEAGELSKSSFKGQFYTELVPYYQVSKSNILFSIVWHLTKGKIARN